jgi:hypothetical protein
MWAAFLTKAERAAWRASKAAGKWNPGVNGGKPRWRKRGGKDWRAGFDFSHKHPRTDSGE